MKKRIVQTVFFAFVVLFLFPAVLGAADAALRQPQSVSDTAAKTDDQPLTLPACYALALKQSELIAVDAELIKQAEAHFLQALGTLLPQVSFSRAETRQKTDMSSSSDRSFEQKIVFQQTLFSGFKEFAAMSGSQLEKRQREHEKRRAEQLLLGDVSDAFYLVLEIREDLRILELIQKALTERIDELNVRENLGKSRASEIATTQTQLYVLEDQIESVRNQEKIAHELLAFLIGRTEYEITGTSEQLPLLTLESEYAARAASRSDVLAADYAWQLDKKRVQVARSGFFPQVDLGVSYYTHRTSAPTDSDWTSLLTITVPIFEGTTTYGEVKEAVSRSRESELLLRRVTRSVSQDIHDAYVNAQSAFARTEILKKAVESAERSYDLQTQDYKLNMVNNLDVLTVLQSLENIRRTYNHMLYESKRAYWQLRIAAGESL